MTHLQEMIGVATLLGAIGLWLMLPRGGSPGRMLGVVLGMASLGLFASQLPWIGDWAAGSVFYILAAVTVISAVATVTLRSPVYCAIWFALSLLGTAGLFLYQGAQFLGVATIVVYAGAILVTFLFVLMLAQPQGQAFYDRISWEGMLSSAAGALMIGVLTLTVASVFQNSESGSPKFAHDQAALDANILSQQHMAHLGKELFSKHLVSVEIAGTLLLVALVGTVAIVSHSQQAGRRRQGDTR